MVVKILVSGLFVIGLTACNPSAEEVGSGSYDPNKVSYFRDKRTDLCYAVSAYSRLDTGGKMSGGISHANVPCNEAVIKLVK